MQSSSTIKNWQTWVNDERRILDIFDYGTNLNSVEKAVSCQTDRDAMIRDNDEQITDTVTVEDEAVVSPDMLNLRDSFTKLKMMSTKTLTCAQTLKEVALLENRCKSLSSTVDMKAVDLVQQLDDYDDTDNINTFNSEAMLRQSQRCMFALKNNWAWIGKLMTCMKTHFDNAAAYHQFFHEANECTKWMETSLKQLFKSFQVVNLSGDRETAQMIIKEIKETLTTYLHWQGKVDSLFHRCGDIVPVNVRVKSLEDPRPVKALCSYKTEDFSVVEGDSLVLLDNDDGEMWQVRNTDNETGVVPAAICLIPAPDSSAVDTAVRLRLQLLALWTGSVKKLGKQIIWFMGLVLRDWDEEEIALLKCLPNEQKAEISRVLDFIETTLKEHWSDYSGYKELQDKIDTLRLILSEGSGAHVREDGSLFSSLIMQIGSLEQLMLKYKDFWTYWETFKVLCETSKQPKYMLIVDKWEQLKFVTSAHFLKYWHTDVTINELEHEEEVAILYDTPKVNSNVKKKKVPTATLR